MQPFRRPAATAIGIAVFMLAASYALSSEAWAAARKHKKPAPGRAQPGESLWVHFGPDGRLTYARSPEGDHIVDFSYAGYRGGGVALPDVTQTRVVKPSGGDDTTAIQSALDAVAALPLIGSPTADVRGAVVLAPGVFHCSAMLKMPASGVVLRGAGEDAQGGTTIELTGAPHAAIAIAGEFEQHVLGAPTALTDSYIPSGGYVIHVADASAIHPNDLLLISKPVTQAWLKFMGMADLHRSDRTEHWIGASDLLVRRRVAAVEGNAITLAVPLTDSIDARFFPGVQAPVERIAVSGQITGVGVEDLRIVAPERSVAYRQDAEFDGVTMSAAVDSWIRSVRLENTTNSVVIGKDTARVTVEHVHVEQSRSVTTSAKNFEFSSNGTQVLFDRCSGRGNDVWFFGTKSREEGPVVVLNSSFAGDGRIQPHERWSTGVLIDSTDVPGGGIDLKNRGTQGSGHGWTTGWSVLWNDTASDYVVQMPPGAANWAIGCVGEQTTAPMPTSGGPKGPPLPEGIIESQGHHVVPASLYLEQLRERLGDAALRAIGYGS